MEPVEIRNMSDLNVYQAMFAKVNGPSARWEKSFREGFVQEHPTLQQAFVRHVIIPALEILEAERPDPRNQGAHDWAVKALEATKDVYLPTI